MLAVLVISSITKRIASSDASSFTVLLLNGTFIKLIDCLLVNLHFLHPCSSPSRLSSMFAVLSGLWLSKTADKVPVWVMRKTLASLASSAQAEWCLACSAATGLRDGWRGGPYRYRSEGSAVRRARGFLRPPRGGACDLYSPAATYFSVTSVQHVGENVITQCVSSRRFCVMRFDEC